MMLIDRVQDCDTWVVAHRKPRRKGGTLKDGERRQLARASRHGPAPALPRASGRPLLLCDGGSRGNPGTAAIAAVLIDGEDVTERAELIGHASAAEAEYRAIVLGLELAAAAGVTELEVRCDSQLAIRAIEGGAAVAAPVFEAARPFRSVRWRWHPRGENEAADALVRALLWP
jgi:ribonuclease HI